MHGTSDMGAGYHIRSQISYRKSDIHIGCPISYRKSDIHIGSQIYISDV